MIIVHVLFLIFQGGKLAEELKGKQKFASAEELVEALISFAARESVMRTNPLVMPLYIKGSPQLELPKATDGYGPKTNVVIKDVEIFYV